MNNVLKERTLIVMKPDAVKRALTGHIISKFENVGLKIIACKMLHATTEQVLGHYPTEDRAWVEGMGHKSLKTFTELNLDVKDHLGTNDPYEIGKKIIDMFVSYWTEGPIIVMIWEGPHAIEVVRKIRGVTTPLQAEPGSILGDFSFDSQLVSNAHGRPMRTFVHASGEKSEADREIKHWFGEEATLFDYYNRTDHTAML